MIETGFELRGVSAGDHERLRLDTVDLDLAPTGITVLAGPSGSGKSSLLRLLNRLDVPSAGTISWRGDSLDAIDVLLHRRQVGMVFQGAVVAPGSVFDNLRLAAMDLDDEAAADLCRVVSLDPGLLDRDAAELSGGEQQRVCLARTIATGPDMILADEPTSSLDPEATEMIEELALRLAHPESPMRMGWIWVTHDPRQLLRLADRVVVLASGRVQAIGAPDELAEHVDAAVRRAVGAET